MGSSATDHVYPVAQAWTVENSSDAARGGNPAWVQDEILMAQVQGGDQIALGTLLDRHGGLIVSIGSRVLRDLGEAQELVPDVFLQVFRKCQRFDPKRGCFRSWLAQIASRRAFDRREYLNLRRFYENRSLDDFIEIIQATGNVDYQLQVIDNRATLRKAFCQLNERQRTTIEMYFFEGYTLREISERTKQTLANTRHHYYRALERLRASIQNASKKDDYDAAG
jgi:RNA polymerase sigma-70 factor, ECF subfamily